jgi:uncharacterized protein
VPVARLHLFLLTFLLVYSSSTAAEPVFPALTGRVVDEASLISAADRAQIASTLEDLETRSGAQVVVVTLRSLQGYGIEELGYKLGRHWGIGHKKKDNGALLIVAPNERSIRIEVGRGLEPTLTDAISKAIIERVILPRFRRGDLAGGIAAGVDEIARVVVNDPSAISPQTLTDEGAGVDWTFLVILLIWLSVILYMQWRAHRAAREDARLGKRGRSRRDDSSSGGFRSTGSSGRSGGWSSGGSSGGGFGGGGGSFGGGGASGRW